MIRIGVVCLCISITFYHGHGCTEKYMSNPSTVNDETVPIDEMPPIQWSICKQFHVEACTLRKEPKDSSSVSGSFYDLFNEQNDEDFYMDVCVFPPNTIPNHANSTETFWKELKARGEKYTVDRLIKSLDTWDRATQQWKKIYKNTDEQATYLPKDIELFRYLFFILSFFSFNYPNSST